MSNNSDKSQQATKKKGKKGKGKFDDDSSDNEDPIATLEKKTSNKKSKNSSKIKHPIDSDESGNNQSDDSVELDDIPKPVSKSKRELRSI